MLKTSELFLEFKKMYVYKKSSVNDQLFTEEKEDLYSPGQCQRNWRNYGHVWSLTHGEISILKLVQSNQIFILIRLF